MGVFFRNRSPEAFFVLALPFAKLDASSAMLRVTMASGEITVCRCCTPMSTLRFQGSADGF
jgi:hypothetical protein